MVDPKPSYSFQAPGAVAGSKMEFPSNKSAPPSPSRSEENRPVSSVEPGPFRADQIAEGDPYELSNGHKIECMSAGKRHAITNLDGGRVLATDPAVKAAGSDLGIECDEGRHLRAPDVVVGDFAREPGWLKGIPGLVLEYADRGQDEYELKEKITQLLERGTKHIWVVRLVGPLRVEVYEQGKAMRIVGDGEVLTAPGVLQNPVPVRSLVDGEAANEATLRNLLNRKGYKDLDAVAAGGLTQGHRQAVLDLCEVLDIELTEERKAHLGQLDLAQIHELRAKIKQTRCWPL